ncbi:hypothetical protein [Cyanobium sp. Copco_Reservoir_LC18]|uniref:hypothetical protein n=1 Tax=Cyanobium sp. Copco_Reservoir_LC18 TaxID=1328305 RepID=UPI00135B237A|nr:hypothetical protein [Cyanobium sp. Copco_Reservoir_LC18]
MHDDEEEALRPELCWMSHEGVYHYAIPDKPDEFSDISGGGDFDNYWNTENLFETSVWDIADAYEELRTLGFFEESYNLREEGLLYPIDPMNTCSQSSGKHPRSQRNTNADLASNANLSEAINDAHSKEQDLISYSIVCQTVSESTSEANACQYETELTINQSERPTHGRQQYTHFVSKAWTLVEGLSNGLPMAIAELRGILEAIHLTRRSGAL